MIKDQKKVIYISDPKLIRVLEKPVPNGIIKCFYKNPLTATEIAEAVAFPKEKIYIKQNQKMYENSKSNEMSIF